MQFNHAIADAGTPIECPVCRSLECLNKKNNLTLCKRCNHIFQTDLLVSTSYDGTYAHQYDTRPVKEMSALRWDFIQSWLRLPHRAKILDVGYGNGAFLKHAKAAGMTIFGIDLHTEDFGIPVVDFETKLEFDLICFFDSLEHIPNFNPLFGIRARHAVISIPDTPSYLLTAPAEWRHYKPGEHLHYFSRTSLHVLMEEWGFRYKVADGHPEDNIRGKLVHNGVLINNIYTAIYSTTGTEADSTPIAHL